MPISDDLVIAASTLDEIEELVVLDESEGGRILKLRTLKSTSDILQKCLSLIKGTHTHLELITLLARLDAQLGVLQELSGAQNNLEQQRSLVDAIIEQAI